MPESSSLNKESSIIKEDNSSAASSTEQPQHAEEETGSSSEGNNESQPYREFLLYTLRKLNCSPIESKENDDIFFKFQGENFCVRQNKGFIRIWDLPFAEINTLDTSMPMILEAINSVNSSFGPTIIMNPPNEDGVREIMSRMDSVFLPMLKEPDQYLSTLLHMFFDLKDELRKEISEWREGKKDEKLSIYSYAASFQN